MLRKFKLLKTHIQLAIIKVTVGIRRYFLHNSDNTESIRLTPNIKFGGVHIKNTVLSIKTLPLSNHFMFGKVMSDQEICREVLQVIIGKPVDKMVIVDVEKTIDPYLDKKGIRLDLFAVDHKNTIFDAELQLQNRNLPLRQRYYRSVIDSDQLEKGAKYTQLKPLYIIFLCTFDKYNRGLCKYTFINKCEEDPTISLEDETYYIYLNTRWRYDDGVDEELKELLSYMENTTDKTAEKSHSQLVKRIYKKVTEIRNDHQSEVEYMNLNLREECMKADIWEDAHAEGVEEGMERGLEKGKRQLVATMWKNGFTIEQIVKGTGIPSDRIRQWIAEEIPS